MKYLTLKAFIVAIFFSYIGSATEPDENGIIRDTIIQTMESIQQHRECHVNIFNLVKELKSILTDREFKKIKVMVMIPSQDNYSYEATYLPTTNWLHHVALLFDKHVYDFFDANQSQRFGHFYSDYLYENFFDFRKMFRDRILSYVTPKNYHKYRGFYALNLIEKNKNVEIENMIISGEDYLNCLNDDTVSFKAVKNSSSYRNTREAFDKKTYLLWYKDRFNQMIDKTDTLLLWDALCQLQWEGIRDNNWVFADICAQVSASFDWKELIEMEKAWTTRELTAYKYYDTVHQASQTITE